MLLTDPAARIAWACGIAYAAERAMSRRIPAALIFASALFLAALAAAPALMWKHLSSAAGDVPTPNTGKEQTSATIADFDKDGVNDFVITERTAADSVVLFRSGTSG